jgi:hypothetical protein
VENGCFVYQYAKLQMLEFYCFPIAGISIKLVGLGHYLLLWIGISGTPSFTDVVTEFLEAGCRLVLHKLTLSRRPFRRCSHLSAKTFEVENGCFVYQYAKLQMLEFYCDFIDVFVDPSDFQY